MAPAASARSPNFYARIAGFIYLFAMALAIFSQSSGRHHVRHRRSDRLGLLRISQIRGQEPRLASATPKRKRPSEAKIPCAVAAASPGTTILPRTPNHR